MIELIEDDGLLDVLKVVSPTSGGISARTILANVEWPDGEIEETFVKFFPPALRVKEIINEAFGHMCTNVVGLEQPLRVGIIKIRLDDIPECVSSVFDGLEDDFATAHGYLYAWATKSIGSQSLKKIYFHPDDANSEANFINAMQAWDDLPKLITLDDWIGNSDRNAGNIIFINSNRFAVIDHGRLFGVINWLNEPLMPANEFTNIAFEVFRIAHGGNPHKIACTPILHEAEVQSEKFQDIRDNLKTVTLDLFELLKMPANSDTYTDSFINYCQYRTSTSKARFNAKLSLHEVAV